MQENISMQFQFRPTANSRQIANDESCQGSLSYFLEIQQIKPEGLKKGAIQAAAKEELRVINS